MVDVAPRPASDPPGVGERRAARRSTAHIEVKGDSLEVSSNETDPMRKRAERFSREYAVMRSGLVGGHGTTLTLVDRNRTRVTPAKGNVEAVKQAMEADYEKAMKVNEI